MNGNVFECYDEQSDRRQYAKTVEALMGYVKKNLKCAEDLKPLFATEMATPTLEKPTKPGDERGRNRHCNLERRCARPCKEEASLTRKPGSNSGRHLGPMQQGYEGENEIPGRI
jgi:hypothetical protein